MPLLVLLLLQVGTLIQFSFVCFGWQCVGIDACLEPKLVEALKVTAYPEIIFTKAGKILHRDKGKFVDLINCLVRK